MSSVSAKYNIEDFEWSVPAIPIREFADRFADWTPFMVVTTSPGGGTSKEMHWLFEIRKEKHVIVQDAEGSYFCIPYNYKTLVKSKKEKHGELEGPMSVEVALASQGTRFIVFEGLEGPPFTEDGPYMSLKHIKAEELLTVKGTHEESHLVLHSFQKGGSLPKNFVMMSDFQSMAVVVAINRQDQRTNQFYADMLQCYDAANGLTHDYESRFATSDIRRLKGLPEKKSHWHNKLKPAWNKLKGMTSSHQKELAPVLEILEKLKKIYSTRVVDDRTEPLYTDIPVSGTTEHRGSEEGRPPSPPRPAYVNGTLRDAMDKSKPNVPPRKMSLAIDEPPTLAPRSTSAHPLPMSDNGAQSQQHCAPAVSVAAPLSASTLRPQTNGGEQKHVTVTRFSKLQDVPRDIKGLSVGEIGDCLMLLNMTQYQQAFQNAQIDGAYLSTMTVEVLKEEFNMSGYQTHRLWQFASQGWRPKTE